MKISMKCCCGATFDMEDAPYYINSGGESDAKGRKFVIEVRADDWQERHQICLGIKPAAGTGEGK